MSSLPPVVSTVRSLPTESSSRCQRGSPTYLSSSATHAFSVDLEDWAYGLLGGDTPITDRVVRNTDRMLGLLDRHGVRGTFFVLGKVCERYPQILPRVLACGHEVASHGYGHERVFTLTPQQFRDDVRRSVDIIGEQVGIRPLGYRAPQFSMTRESLWAVSILAELGFEYSSSVFPFVGRRYGIGDSPRYLYRHRGSGLLEFPMTTWLIAGRRIPVCGGGYLRLLPSYFLRAAIEQANRAGWPAVVYMHPYELDTDEVSQLRGQLSLSRYVAFKQSLFRRMIPKRLGEVFDRFRFSTMREVIRQYMDESEGCGLRLVEF